MIDCWLVEVNRSAGKVFFVWITHSPGTQHQQSSCSSTCWLKSQRLPRGMLLEQMWSRSFSDLLDWIYKLSVDFEVTADGLIRVQCITVHWAERHNIYICINMICKECAIRDYSGLMKDEVSIHRTAYMVGGIMQIESEISELLIMLLLEIWFPH